jgi:hypothetical protein
MNSPQKNQCLWQPHSLPFPNSEFNESKVIGQIGTVFFKHYINNDLYNLSLQASFEGCIYVKSIYLPDSRNLVKDKIFINSLSLS